ncbi:MAG: alpha/beta hydrolase [Blastocatellia bacterium]
MKNTLQQLTALITLALALTLSLRAQNDALAGNWLARLEFNGSTLRLVLKIVANSDGSLIAKLDSLDQGARDLPMDEITQEGDTLRFVAQKLGLHYEGKLNLKGAEIAGTLKQGGGALPLVFRRTAVAPTLHRPQDPLPPYPYHEEEVSYKNENENVKLAGTLTFPRDGKRHPAVLLITGAGAQDRNETIAGHRPFLVLADALTRAGIAVLRVDDRGVGGSDAGVPNPTSENYVEDVLAGIAYLKTRQEIAPQQIGLIGHSEGGMIAPLAAVRSSDVAFIVLLAGGGQPGTELIYTQTALQQKKNGVAASVTAQTIAAQQQLFAILQAEPENTSAEKKLRACLQQQLEKLPADQRAAFASGKATLEAQIPLFLSAWFRYFIAYDPRPTLVKVKVPVLALNGENDVQAAAKENLSLIAAALKAGGNRDYTIQSFPKLNHLFQTSETGLPHEYERSEETIAPAVLTTITNWILQRTHQR